MRTAKHLRPYESFRKGHRTIELDARVTKKQHKELFDLIVESVEWTQKFIQTELPNIIILTQEQFASLNNWTQDMYSVTDRILVTPYNVMEVVVDREIDTMDEIEEVFDMLEEIEQAEKEAKDGSTEATD